MDFEIGKWYKYPSYVFCLVEKLDDDYMGRPRYITYGIDRDAGNRWLEDDIRFLDDTVKESTNKEVKELLVKEAKKRGLVSGVSVIKPKFGEDRLSGNKWVFDYSDSDCHLSLSGRFVFYNGKWAEIINSEVILEDGEDKEEEGESNEDIEDLLRSFIQ